MNEQNAKTSEKPSIAEQLESRINHVNPGKKTRELIQAKISAESSINVLPEDSPLKKTEEKHRRLYLKITRLETAAAVLRKILSGSEYPGTWLQECQKEITQLETLILQEEEEFDLQTLESQESSTGNLIN